jgi:beta-phosphoglucomutase-like phosphatase (HAD superfamily)
MRRTFEHFGIQVGLDEMWRQIGKGGDKIIALVVSMADRERLEKSITDFRKQIFHRDYMQRMVAFSQAGDLLRRVRSAGMKIALATSSEKEDLPVYGKLVGMDDLVDEASSSTDAKASKPDPDIFAAALKKVKMRPANWAFP